ncbi:MAG: diacylglycerol kinase family protein [Patescibacteria group bacterium]|jgi:diacylglycerol kinase family enzyme
MNPSYAYVYDDFLADRRFERDVAALETKLSTFDMSGHIGRMSLFRSAKDLVQGMVAKGATTVVVVGNDGTLDKTMWFLPDLNITVGYVPLVGPSAVGKLLGIPMGAGACDVLAARRIETLDMGKLDDRYFLTEVSLPATVASLSIEGKYTISPLDGGALSVRNLGGRVGNDLVAADAKDGWLEAVVTPRSTEGKAVFWKRSTTSPETRVLLQHGQIQSKDPIEAHADNHAVSGFSFHVSVVPAKLRLITGRGRRSIER